MSTNGALGPEASKFLTVVFKHAKAASMFSMRHSHQDTDSTWNTTWFSTFWRQRISSTFTATNAAFVNRILQRDYVFQKDGPSIAKAPPCPRFYYYDPKLNRRPCNHRNPHQPGYKVASSSTNFLSGLLSVGFPSFSFLYHTTDSAIFFSQPHNQMSECQNFMNQLSVIQSERVVVSCC